MDFALRRITLENAKAYIDGRSKPDGECIVWSGPLSVWGYGKASFRGKSINAHRLMWMAVRGVIADGLFVCHHCDNAACVKIDHLYLGTPKQNSADRENRNRANKATGERNAYAKIKWSDARDIRLRFSRGESIERISEDYPIEPQSVRRIINNQTWKIK